MAYNEVWDLNTPQGSEARSLGDDRIREMKRALQERLATIMNFPDGNPLELTPAYVNGLGLHDGAQINDASIPDSKLLGIGGTKITDHTIEWTKVTNNFEARLGYSFPFTLSPGQSPTHPGVSVIVASSSLVQWNYPVGTEFNPGANGHVPSMDAGTVIVLTINPNPSLVAGSGQLTLIWSTFYDGSQLTISAYNPTTANITIPSGFPFKLVAFSTFANSANAVTGAYGNPTT